MKIIAKKSLGQNFLKSQKALNKMLEVGEVGPTDIVLEVGPGKGILTEKLLRKARKVIAVEKDDRLIAFLQDKFATEITNGKLEIIHDDILDFEHNLSKPHLNPPPREGLSETPSLGRGRGRLEREKTYKIIANIPYYITGQFLRKFLENDNQPERIVVMVQKEIADRIVAQAGKESILSISVKAYGNPKKILKVTKENFSPAPKVDSAILLISNISKKLFTENKINEKRFFEILHAGFAHKRKILMGNLKNTFGADKINKIFTECQINEKARAENLTVEQWLALASL